jgi:hypothetical protein
MWVGSCVKQGVPYRCNRLADLDIGERRHSGLTKKLSRQPCEPGQRTVTDDQ